MCGEGVEVDLQTQWPLLPPPLSESALDAEGVLRDCVVLGFTRDGRCAFLHSNSFWVGVPRGSCVMSRRCVGCLTVIRA